MRLPRSSGRAFCGFIRRASFSRPTISFVSRCSIPSSEPRAGLFIETDLSTKVQTVHHTRRAYMLQDPPPVFVTFSLALPPAKANEIWVPRFWPFLPEVGFLRCTESPEEWIPHF